ncbi:STAS-like domain-containing protein [Weissella confusa]|uniref:STAS-like domain-containing protein n=1 Tax=Weissella confusa TaxID=1583 RepID=UPI00177D1414|nr:STAS-like domain-containing protein [Weissella confusa]MBD5833850.1 hypothetical protein [Weissella confusa]
MKEQVIKLFEILGKEKGLDQHDGEIIHEIIATNIKNQTKSIVDFSGLSVIPSFFINHAIGQLYSEYSSNTLNDYVSFDVDTLTPTQIKQIKIAMSIARTQLSSEELDADER